MGQRFSSFRVHKNDKEANKQRQGRTGQGSVQAQSHVRGLEVGDVGAQDGFNGRVLAEDGQVQGSVTVVCLVQSIGTSSLHRIEIYTDMLFFCRSLCRQPLSQL